MNVLTIGSVAYDSITTPFGKAEHTLGGSATYFTLAASFFSQPGLVAVVGEDFAAQDEKLFAEFKIDTTGLAKLSGQTFAWGGEYGFDLNNRQTIFTHLNVLEQFNPRLSEQQRSVPFVFLGNFHPATQKQVLQQLKDPVLVGLDTMNYWIEHNYQELTEVLTKVRALVINDSELRELTKEFNVFKAAKQVLRQMGGEGKFVIVKRGEYGLLLFYGKEIFHVPAFPLEEVFDPTGAGDSFAGGFMGYLADKGEVNFETVKQACVAGSVVASFCVEKMGVERFIGLTSADIAGRLRAFKKLTQFESA